MKQAPLLFVPSDSEGWIPPDLPDLSDVSTIELDCETTGVSWQTGDRPVGLAVGAGERRWYLPFAHRGGQNLCETTVKRWADQELRGKTIRNLKTKFDLHEMRVWGVDLTEASRNNTFHDVSHSAALLDDHRRTFSLDDLAQAELGEGKLDVGPKDGIADLPAGAVAPYAMRDVELVRRLADVYAPRLRAEGLEDVSRLEDDVLPVVVEIEKNGMPVDLEGLEGMVRESGRILEDLAHALWKRAGFHVNPDAPTDMVRLFQQCGETFPRTPTGAPSFPSPVVQAAGERHEAIRLAWRLGKLKDLRSKYLVKYQKDQIDGILYPSLNQLPTDEGGTVSGRFSCTKIPLQGVLGADRHKRAYHWLTEYGAEDFLIKKLFRPASGVWCSADMKQVEYRIFVHYTESERLIQRYRDDPQTDFHRVVGEFVTPVRPDITRTEIKTFNFLTLFGGGISAASRQLEVPMEVANEIAETYHSEFPEARQLLSKVMGVADRRGYVKSIMGRRSRFPGRPGTRERLHKSLNCIVQGGAADANKLALVDVYRERRALDLTMRMTVHDSLETDLHNPSKLGAYVTVLNRQRLPFSVPLLWDVKTGPTWAACK